MLLLDYRVLVILVILALTLNTKYAVDAISSLTVLRFAHDPDHSEKSQTALLASLGIVVLGLPNSQPSLFD